MSEDKVKASEDAKATDQTTGDEPATEEETVEAQSDTDANPENEAGDAANEESKDTGEEASSSNAESERYMRLMAEFQNYKKRVAKEKTDIREYATEKLLTELLTVLDNFERALSSSADEDPAGYAKGMELIFTQLKGMLENSGLQEVEALGVDFDPAKHNAVMTEDSDEYESGKVSKVLQKGYAINDKVIRPSMVAVAN